ncbi:MAG TPA: UDP-N-acetylmuramoyl-L-alanine--D-glutamate ligase [Acidimicrobiales bacterium]|nr:UDP-N-acetylmuramoyl-L-alanine--D-glutamate ligase [Acidimicrobiales bacterium]
MSASSPGHKRAVVIGWGVSGRAAARWFTSNDWDVCVIEDDQTAASEAARAVRAGGGGYAGRLSVVAGPAAGAVAELVARADLVVPSPGVKMGHPALVCASRSSVPVWSEIELASSQLALLRPGSYLLVAITGTNGKTTVTELVTEMLRASGLRALAVGNVGYPLLDAVSQVAGAGRTALVTEVSSFQLEFTAGFAPSVSCWLNFSPDHLDWHPSIEHYASAKAKIWANQKPGTTVVANADDPVVMRAAQSSLPAGATLVTFGNAAAGASAGAGPHPGPTWCFGPEGIRGPAGFELAASELPRAFPHDLANTTAAFAVALAAGATAEGAKQAARVTAPPHHRVELVAEAGGTAWYDDSKATTPASVLAAVSGFSSVVLLAGGRNKGLDLSVLAASVPPVRAVVAIGENAAEIAAIFEGRVPVHVATSMVAAVEAAISLARPGDAVVLSPGCASFDWYSSYAERGEDFSATVRAKLEEVAIR